MTKVVRAVDLFCGGGGTSTGLASAMKAMGRPVELVAVNHWQVAVETHARNHPWAQHRCERVEAVDKFTIFPKQKLDLLVASPECVAFSNAKGGRPVNDQRRTGAWYVLDWITQLQPRGVLIENVPEFRKWGKLDKNGRQIKHSEGAIFKSFIEAIRGVGYNVDYRVLNSADYGACTTRRRLFIMARRGKQPVHWPEPTHADPKKGSIPDGLKPWRAAREILDFTLPSESVFGVRKNGREVVQRTLDRIAKGLRSSPQGPLLEPLARAVETRRGPIPLRELLGPQGAPAVESVLLHLTHGGRSHDPNDPLPTVTGAHRGELALAESVVFGVAGPRRGEAVDTDRPFPTMLTREEFALAEARFTLGQQGGAEMRSASDPMATIAAGGALRLVEALIFGVRGRRYHREAPTERPFPALTTREEFVVAHPLILPPRGIRGGEEANPAYPAEAKPLHTLTQRDAHLVEPVVVNLSRPETNRSVGRSTNEPLPTITGTPQIGVVDPAIVETAVFLPAFGERPGQDLRTQRVTDPIPTITAARGAPDLAFLDSYYGNGIMHDIDDPLGTQTAKDRHSLVTAELVRAHADAILDGLYVDVRLRMLHPKELAAAMGFPADYQFTGTRTEIVKQIGNAVEVNVARALVTSLMTGTRQPVLDVYQGDEPEAIAT